MDSSDSKFWSNEPHLWPYIYNSKLHRLTCKYMENSTEVTQTTFMVFLYTYIVTA